MYGGLTKQINKINEKNKIKINVCFGLCGNYLICDSLVAIK